MKFAEEIKLAVRYIMISFVLFLVFKVTAVPYVVAISAANPEVVVTIVVASFAALTLILKYHFSTKVDK